MTRSSTALAHPSGPVLRALYQRLPAGRVLNIGAGNTHTIEASQWTVHVDVNAPVSSGEAKYLVADAAALPFAGEAFDGALLKDVVEHAVDAIAVLREAHRVVRPGGMAVVVVPRAIARAVWDDPTHVRGFTARALVTAAELAHWRVARLPVRVGGFPGAGRLHLERFLPTIMRLPGFGHWFGTNWLMELARP